MADLEKVIKGLESCSPDYPRLIKCVGCPYEQNCRHGGRNESLLMDALTLLKEQEAVEPKKESDGNPERWASWWYVCGNCGVVIDCHDMYCRHCGKAVKWD